MEPLFHRGLEVCQRTVIVSLALLSLLVCEHRLLGQVPGLESAPVQIPPAMPVGELVEGADGHFYGAAMGSLHGYGTIIKVSLNGVIIPLASFNGKNGRDPQGLVLAKDGNFYGTTRIGGAKNGGTVFKMTPDGALTTLVSFGDFNDPGGCQPYAGLVQGTDGNFYGTTRHGGAARKGTVFKVSSGGELTSLASFEGKNGSTPGATLIQGKDGNFYGTTEQGGPGYGGTVFRMTPKGELTILVSFDPQRTGRNPQAGVVEGSDGSFYGTTAGGGTGGHGTVFMVTTEGKLTTLASFNHTDGAQPFAKLLEGPDGMFYGTTAQGGGTKLGSIYCGTLFKVSKDGSLTTLLSFDRVNGRNPWGGLVRGSDGNYYGTTRHGGSRDAGTVFRLTPEGKFTSLVSF